MSTAVRVTAMTILYVILLVRCEDEHAFELVVASVRIPDLQSRTGAIHPVTRRIFLYFFSLLIPLNEICHVALSYLRMYACNPGTLWGEHPSEQVGSIVQHLGRNI